MSGGSYDYLCHKSPDELFGRIGQLTLMQARLEELGHADAAASTAHTIRLLRQCYEQIERQTKAISDVWHAVEWCDSGDWGEDQVKAAIERWRALGLTVTGRETPKHEPGDHITFNVGKQLSQVELSTGKVIIAVEGMTYDVVDLMARTGDRLMFNEARTGLVRAMPQGTKDVTVAIMPPTQQRGAVGTLPADDCSTVKP